MESGFFDVWKTDHEINPWHYDLAAMEDVGTRQPDGVRWYCEGTMLDQSRTDDRFVKNIEVYRSYQANRPRKTFVMLIAFYDMLIENHIKRIDVAEAWLMNNGALTA